MMQRGRKLLGALVILIGSSITTIAQAEDELAIELDWSAAPDSSEKMAYGLQRDALLPIPLIYINGTPAGMLGDVVELNENEKSKIEIGLKNLTERPLYSFTWDPLESSREIPVELPVFASYFPNESKSRPTLLLKGVDKYSAKVVTGNDKQRALKLPAGPYASIAGLTAETYSSIDWTSQPVLNIYQENPKSGEVFAPAPEKAAIFGDVDATKEQLKQLGDVYYSNIEASWFSETVGDLRFLQVEQPERLLLKSIPSNAEIYVSGTLQAEQTDAPIKVLKRLWPEVFIRLAKYRDCAVDLSQVQPPAGDGEPSVFVCKLKRR